MSDHQPLSVLFNLGPATSFSDWVPLFLAGGIFLPLWVLFTFESAGAVGEEVKGAKKVAPKAIMLAFIGTMIIGTYFLLTVILAIPDVDEVMASANPIVDILDHWLPPVAAKIYLILLLGIEILGCNAFFTAVSRQVFGMARSWLIPGSRWVSRTRRGTPTNAIITVGILTSLPLLIAQTMSVLAGGATAAIYGAYIVLLATVLVARFRGWPQKRNEGGFNLGKWGIPVNVLALAFAIFAFILLNWPADATNPAFAGIRVTYWLIGIPIVLGVIFYIGWIRKTKGRLTSLESEDLAEAVESQDVEA